MSAPGLAALAALALPLATSAVLGSLAHRQATPARIVSALSVAAQLAAATVLLFAMRTAAPLALPLGAGLVLVVDRLTAWLLLASTACAVLACAAGMPILLQRREQLRLQAQLLIVATGLLAAGLAALWLCIAASVVLASSARRPGPGGAAAARRITALGVGYGALGAFVVLDIYRHAGVTGLAALAATAPQLPAAAAMPLAVDAAVLLALLVIAAAGLPHLLWSSREQAGAPLAALLMAGMQGTLILYALLRVYTLVFPCFAAGPCSTAGLVLPAGLALVMAGAVGAIGAGEPRRFAAFLVVFVAGLALTAAGDFRVTGLATAIFYLLQLPLTAVALLAAAELAASAAAAGARFPLPLVAAAAAAIGLPPFPGWFGLLALLQASVPDALVVWTLVPSSMLLALVATLRLACGSRGAGGLPPRSAAKAIFMCAMGSLALLSLLARPALDYATGAARQLLDRAGYVAAVHAALGG